MTGRVVIDAAIHRREVRDLTRRYLSRVPGTHLLLVIAVPTAIGLVGGSWALGLVTAALVTAGLVGWRWSQAVRALRPSHAVGDVVSLAYTPHELVLDERFGRVWLGRGSVHRVDRGSALDVVVSRRGVFMTPQGLLDETDTAFLEGHGEPGPATAPERPVATHQVEVDDAVQAALVAGWTRQAVLRGQVCFWAVLAGLSAIGAVLLAAIGVVFWAVWCAVGGAGDLWAVGQQVRGTRRLARERHPIGSQLAAGVVEDGVLVVSGPHHATHLPWASVRSHRLDHRTLELRLTAAGTVVLPARLLSVEDLREVIEQVPTTH